jgi:acetyl esterase/lipase
MDRAELSFYDAACGNSTFQSHCLGESPAMLIRSISARVAASLILLGGLTSAMAEDAATILLWEHGAPGAKGAAENDKPKLTAYRPAEGKSVSTAVIICPGGGYGHLSLENEGSKVAEWLNSLGVTAFVLDYRHAGKGYHYPAPVDDAQRAIRYVRSNAATWNIDPAKIGIMGFSAGGHLASTAGTHFDGGKPDADDKIDHASSRPDFLILCYPVISMTSEFTHQGSKKNLIGDHPDAELAKSMSNETQITSQTPPTFIFQTNADTAVPAENSVQFYLALRKAKVPAEMHIYQNGQHGVGLAPNDPVLSTWKDRLADWLKMRGLLR